MTLHGVQLIRAFAAAMVVVFHVGRLLLFKTGADITPLTVAGAGGVDLFFVVSGFIMIYTTANRQFSAPEFLWRRAARVAPLYWLLTIVMGVLVLAVPERFVAYRIEPLNFASAFVFFPSYNFRDEIFPPLNQGWTLVYEMFFYLAFAVTSRFMFAKRLPVLFAAFAALVICGLVWSSRNAAFVTYTDPILFEFLFGCLAAELLIHDRLHFGARIAVALIVIGAVSLLAGTVFAGEPRLRVLYWGAPSFLIVLGVTRAEAFLDFSSWRIGGAIGDSSYSLYLSHTLVLSALGLIFRFGIGHAWGGVPLAPLFVVACLIVGWLCWRYVERPMTRALTRRRIPEQTASVVQ